MILSLKLPAAAYHSESLTQAFLSSLSWPIGVALIAVIAMLMMTGVASLKWAQLHNGQQIKWFILFLSALMIWYVATLSHNAYFDQSYVLDRLALLLLFALLFWRPIFIFPVLVVTFLLYWQLAQPTLNNGSHFAHKLQVLHVLNMFSAWLLLHVFDRRRDASEFVVLSACLIASAYWAPAVKKLFIGWLYSGELFNMPLNAHAHGWLSFLSPEVVVAASLKFAALDWPARLFVIAIEAGSLIFLWHRRYALSLLILVSIFHVGVFVLFGYLFWTWILLNAAFFLLLFCYHQDGRESVFTRAHLLCSILLILTSGLWCFPATLGWIDGRISYTYRYAAIGESNQRYEIPFEFFEPYGDVFTMANFSYLVDDHKMLTSPYGSTTRSNAAALMAAKNLEDVAALEHNIGWSMYDQSRVEDFREFLSRWISNSNAKQTLSWIEHIQPPRQFWTHPRANPYSGQEEIKSVVVSEITTLFDGAELTEIREVEVMNVSVDHNATSRQ